MNNDFLNFKKKSETETELYVYGNIEKKDWIDDWFGTGNDKTNAYSLKDALMKVDTPILTVRINSFGGSVSEGLAIYSLLSEFKGTVRTIVDGFACSAASVVFMAGSERIVPEQGLLMIHNAWTYAEGDSNVMKKTAEDLEKITQPSLNIYVSKTGLSESVVKEMMDREEWITCDEAFELGFSTSKGEKAEAKQLADANLVHNLVMKNKQLEKELAEQRTLIVPLEENNDNTIMTKNTEITTEILETNINDIKDSVATAINELLQRQTEEIEQIDVQENSNQIKEDAWTSFFNKKN